MTRSKSPLVVVTGNYFRRYKPKHARTKGPAFVIITQSGSISFGKPKATLSIDLAIHDGKKWRTSRLNSPKIYVTGITMCDEDINYVYHLKINPSEAVEEKVSLSDRFGLWLGFHPCSQDEYLAMIRGYCDAHGVEIDDEALRAEAIEWQATRGARSGRVAWQYFTDLAGRRGVRI